MFGPVASPHTCSAGAYLPAVAAESPAHTTICHATCVRTRRESEKWMRTSCCCTWRSRPPTRWTHHSFDSTPCFATCYKLGDVLEKCVTLERSVSLLPSTKTEKNFVLHRALLWFLCLHHIASYYFSVISLAQPPVEFLLKVAWCHGKFRIVFLPPRVQIQSSRIIFGIP